MKLKDVKPGVYLKEQQLRETGEQDTDVCYVKVLSLPKREHNTWHVTAIVKWTHMAEAKIWEEGYQIYTDRKRKKWQSKCPALEAVWHVGE